MNKKKYTRREAIKYGAKVGFGATLWGTIGNLLGRGYETGRDFYRSDVKPALDKVERGTSKIEEWGDNINRTLNPWYEPKSKEKEEQPKLTRRGFLKSLAWQAHEHPVAAGTLIGATYGVGKYAISGLGRYLTNRQIAVLKDENANYRERLEILEQYRIGAEKDLEGKEGRIRELEKSVDELGREIKRQGKLEEKASEGEAPGESKKPLLIFGYAGLLISIGLSSISITGKTILDLGSDQVFSASVMVFVISIVLIFFGIKKRKN